MPSMIRDIASLTALLAFSPALSVSADQFTESGYTNLVARLGVENVPTGFGVLVGQIEVGNAQGHYAPNQSIAEFQGKTFILRSGNTGGNNGHATAVGRNIYGLTTGLAPGVTEIHAFEVNDWIGPGFLRFGSGPTPPLDLGEVKILNNSWVGNGTLAQTNEINRRLDFAIVEQDLLLTYGMNNTAGPITFGLLAHAFNGLSVGRKDGNHEFGLTLAGLDAPGRMKPEIVAPRATTSDATGLISATAAMLVETARLWPGLETNPNAERSEVIKAALLAGADHRPNWTNNPATSGPERGVTARPLDERYGVDVVDINRAHEILTGLEFNGSTDVPTLGSAPFAAWDLAALAASSSVHYRFELAEDKPTFSAIATWHRRPSANFATWTMPDVTLELYRVASDGTLISLRGDEGLDYFESGNIASVSTVDNVEHLFIRNLAAGKYVLAVSRAKDGLGAWDVAVAWHMPPDTFLAADPVDYSVDFGHHISGGLEDITASDNVYLRTRSVFGFTALEPNIMQITVGFVAPNPAANALLIGIESRINNPSGKATVRLRNWTTGTNQLVHTYDVTMTESLERFMLLDAQSYVGSKDGRINLAVRHAVIATFTALGFDSFFDFIGVEVND